MQPERLIVRRLFDHCAFAVREDGSDVYIENNSVMNIPLYVGREIWAQIVPSKIPGKSPLARNIQLEPPPPTPAGYNPALSPEEGALWKLFLELKTQYHTLRLSRPLPALTEQMLSWAEELEGTNELAKQK